MTIESATFRMSSLRVIGDAGASDPRTTQQGVVVAWDASKQPAAIPFSTAPSGLYSKVSLAIDGQLVDDSYLITGHANVSSSGYCLAAGTYAYTIHDTFALSVDLSANAQLDPGTAVSLPIKIDLALSVSAVDWDKVDCSDGKLTLDTDDEWISTFRALLIASFSIDADR